MPDNIEGLLADFGLDPNSGTPDTDATEPQTEEANASTEDVNTESNTDEPTQEQASEEEDTNSTENAEAEMEAQMEQQRANEAFAAMRAENNKYKKFMQTLMRGSNFTGDEGAFIEALENEAYKRQAQIQGMQANPELLRKVDQQEEQIRALTQSQRDQALMLGLKTLQQTHNLTGKEVETFVKRAVENKIDLLAPGVNFDTLYKGMFFDDIVNKKLEDERQNWIKQSSKADSAATPDGKSGKKENTPTDVKTMAEFNSLLNTVSKEIK